MTYPTMGAPFPFSHQVGGAHPADPYHYTAPHPSHLPFSATSRLAPKPYDSPPSLALSRHLYPSLASAQPPPSPPGGRPRYPETPRADPYPPAQTPLPGSYPPGARTYAHQVQHGPSFTRSGDNRAPAAAFDRPSYSRSPREYPPAGGGYRPASSPPPRAKPGVSGAPLSPKAAPRWPSGAENDPLLANSGRAQAGAGALVLSAGFKSGARSPLRTPAQPEQPVRYSE